MSAFEELGVMPEIIRGVEELDWLLPTPVQSESIPLILGGGDVMVAAETGSGKTGAFALPILQLVHETLIPQKASASEASASSSKVEALESCRLNDEDRDMTFHISEDGLQCQNRTKGWSGGRANLGAFQGRVYYEVTLQDEGLCRVGWASRAANYEIGKDARSFGFGSTGKKSHGGAFTDYGRAFGKGETVGCLLDMTQHKISFTLNGADMGPAFDVPVHMRNRANALFPAITLKGACAAANFGKIGFSYGPPPGYVGLAKAPSEHVISAASGEAAAAESGARTPIALILEPSRDLAQQTHDNISSMRRYLTNPSLRNALLVGGTQPREAIRDLKEGVDIVTGTPGRIIDFVETGKLVLGAVKYFVLDEADRLLDTGNQDTIMKLFSHFPKAGTGVSRLQVMMFSATLHSDEVKQMAAQICQNPTLVDLRGKEMVPDSVDHVVVPVDPKEDRSWLQTLPAVPTDNAHAHDRIGPNENTPENWSEAVKRLKPRVLQRIIDTHKMEQCLVFCRTNFDCDNLETFLNALGGGGKWTGRKEKGKENPYSCVVLAGARSTDERRDALQAFKEGEVRFLICTDVGARGLDISGLPYVINMTLPDRAEDYIHRVGRVGRAEKLGLAISLVSAVPERVWYCTRKGYRPWLKPTKFDVKSHEENGHTIWYNEQQLLKEIEERLRQPIPTINPDMTLPAEIAQRIAASAEVGAAAYGRHKEGGDESKVLLEHVEALKPVVDELSRLETLAQEMYFRRKMGFGQLAGLTLAG